MCVCVYACACVRGQGARIPPVQISIERALSNRDKAINHARRRDRDRERIIGASRDASLPTKSTRAIKRGGCVGTAREILSPSSRAHRGTVLAELNEKRIRARACIPRSK